MNINLINLFNNPKKSISNINLEAKIFSLNDLGEIFTITLKTGNNVYKDFTIIKGELFPNPKEDNLILIDNITFKYDEQFNLRLYLKARLLNNKIIIKDNDKNINNTEDKIDIFDFSEDNIIKTLKSLLKININLYTSLFIVDSINEKYYSIKDLQKNEMVLLEKNDNLFLTPFNIQDIILISEYYLEKNNIILSPLSIIEKLSDEKLFIFFEKRGNTYNKLLWGKILEIKEDNKIVILMDKNKNILKFNNINNYEIKLGQYFIFSDYIINKENEIILNKSSFIYFSNQDIYFSNKINLNLYSVIQLYFIDYKSKEDNIYKAVKLKNEIKTIKDNQMNFIVENKKSKYYEFFITTISLLFNEDFSYGTQIFYISILQGFINKFNVFINFKSDFSYYYEYLYYSFTNFDFLRTKEIKINGNTKNISIYDNFGSINRLRFNILNIPFQNECEKNILGQNNSLLICETFYKNPKEPKIFGIFNIGEIMFNSKIIKSNNNVFDKYYDEFGNFFEDLKMSQFDKEKIAKFIEKYIDKYKLFQKELNNSVAGNFLTASFYEEEISLSQLKTRIGIISSYYLSTQNSYISKYKVYKKLKDIFDDISLFENIFTNGQILRIFILLTKRIIEKELTCNLVVLSDFERESSPYIAAEKFNLEEITNINEFSRLFSGYLQMDSLILYNYNFKEKSYSFCLEPIFILKYHLKSNYEGFFCTENQYNNIIAFTDIDTRITIINKENLFERSEFKDPSIIKNNETEVQNHAFGISMVFRHEKNSHQKKNLKNGYIASPCCYCDNGEKKTIIVKNENDEFTGEDIVLIEILIAEQSIILSLAKDFIYGQLLDYQLFIENDFEKLKEKVNNIKENNKEYFEQFQSYKYKKEDPKEQNAMKDYNNTEENGEKISREHLINIIKRKELQIGDQIYSLDLIKEMIKREKMKNQFHLLPKIIQELDKVKNKKKNN